MKTELRHELNKIYSEISEEIEDLKHRPENDEEITPEEIKKLSSVKIPVLIDAFNSIKVLIDRNDHSTEKEFEIIVKAAIFLTVFWLGEKSSDTCDKMFNFLLKLNEDKPYKTIYQKFQTLWPESGTLITKFFAKGDEELSQLPKTISDKLHLARSKSPIHRKEDQLSGQVSIAGLHGAQAQSSSSFTAKVSLSNVGHNVDQKSKIEASYRV